MKDSIYSTKTKAIFTSFIAHSYSISYKWGNENLKLCLAKGHRDTQEMRHGYSNPHLLAPTQFNTCARTNHVLLCHHIYREELLPNSRLQAQLFFFFRSLNKVHWLHPLPAHIHKITKCQHSNLPEFSFSVHVAITNWLWAPNPFHSICL